MIKAKILLASEAPDGSRLYTYELTYPRFIHSEVMTHRAFSKNSASSRAIPFEKMTKLVAEDTAYPERWPEEQKGMQGGEELPEPNKRRVMSIWKLACDNAITVSEMLHKEGLHKSLCNRILEPFAHMTVIFTGTRKALGHFFALRANPAAMPEFQVLAYRMLNEYLQFDNVQFLREGDWHIPFDESSYPIKDRLKIATGRIARVSYLTHDGVRDFKKDIELHDKLASAYPMHASPFEHCAMVVGGDDDRQVKGNFGRPWIQYRSMMNNETIEVNDGYLAELDDQRPAWITV